jgi:hypothetical protein
MSGRRIERERRNPAHRTITPTGNSKSFPAQTALLTLALCAKRFKPQTVLLSLTYCNSLFWRSSGNLIVLL